MRKSYKYFNKIINKMKNMNYLQMKSETACEKDLINETSLINNLVKLKKNKHSFLISHTLIAKGLASLMLLYHHLLRPGNKFNKGFKNELVIIGIDFRKYISIFFKITTCSYTFLSGVGLYYSLIKLKTIKEMYKKCIKNFFRLMAIFWIILIFVFPKGLKTGLFKLDYSTIIHCICADYYRKGNWWYIRMHFALLIYSPLFVRLFQDINYKNKFIPIMIFYFIYLIIKLIKTWVKFGGMITILFDYFRYFSQIDIILSFLSGIFAAKYDLMSIFDNDNYECYYYCIFSIYSSILIRINLISREGDSKIDFFIVPLFLLPITSLISKNYALTKFISLFGKHSTNFWFLHGYFYDNYYLDILSLPKYSTLCYIWLIILTLISSYLVNIVLIPVINFINSKGFNYKG